jgi:hypothetical protein
MRPLACAALPVLLCGCIVIDDWDCRLREDREKTVPAPAGLRTVEVRALAGALEVHGVADTDAVRVTGVACARRERDLSSIDIDARADGDRVVIDAQIGLAARRRGARLDLVVEVPAGVTIEVDDQSGDVVIDGVAGAKIEDGSGDLRIENVPGDVAVVDESGDVWLGGVGAVRLDDDSGDVTIRDAQVVTVLEDGSGDLEVRDVARDVVVLDDGSGDITVSGVGGDLRVEDGGSGDVEHTDIAGSVEIH